jgi:hypothetical protein
LAKPNFQFEKRRKELEKKKKKEEKLQKKLSSKTPAPGTTAEPTPETGES